MAVLAGVPEPLVRQGDRSIADRTEKEGTDKPSPLLSLHLLGHRPNPSNDL